MAENQIVIKVVANGAAEASRILAGVAASGGQIGSVVAGGAAQARKELDGLGGSAKRVLEIFTGFTAANFFVQGIERMKSFVEETAKLGLEAKVQEDAFERLSKSVGVAGDALVAEMQKASGGILNTSDVMIAAAKALNNSLQPEQIVNLMTVARAQSKLAGIDVAEAFNRITQAVSTQMPREFKKTFGTVVDFDGAIKALALSLGVEVSQLSEAHKTQAAYGEVMRATKESTAALTEATLTQSEQVQKTAGQWKQFKEDLGKWEVDALFKVLGWLKQVKDDVGDISPSLEELGKVWAATWTNAKASLEPFATTLGGLKGIINGVLEAVATMGVGANLVFTQLVGPITFVSLLLGDLANKRLPDMAAHGAAVATAMNDANKKFDESVAALTRMRVASVEGASGIGEVGMGFKGLAIAADMGKNRLADVSGQIKPLVLSLKDLAAAQLAVLLQQQASTTAAVAMEEALAQQGVALHQLHESDLTAVQQKALDVRAVALQRQYVLELNLAKQQGVSAGKAIADVEAKYIKSFSDIAVARVALSTAMQKAVADEMHATFQAAAALTNGPATSTQPLLDAMDAWTKLGIAIDKVNESARIDGDEQKRLADSIVLTRTALDDVAARFGSSSDDAEIMRLRLHGLLDEMTRLQTFRATADDVAEAWSFVTDASDGATKALGDYSAAVGIAEQESQLLGKGLGDELGTKIGITEQAILKAAKAFGVESEAVKLLQDRLAGLKVDQFVDDMNQISAQAILMGNRFDGAGAEISRFQKLLTDKLRETNNVITPEVADIAAKLNGMIDANKLRQALGLSRTVFDDFVDLARSTASASTTFLQDGFFALVNGDFKGLDDAAKAFGLAMERAVLNFLASKAVSLLMEWLSDLFTGLSGSGSGGIFGSLIAGAGALLAKFSGSSVEKVADAATTSVDALNGVGLSATGASKGLDLLDLKVTNFSAGVSAALSAIGVGIGIYNLAQGGSAGSMALSAGGTALSLYSLAVSASELAVNAGLIGTALPTIGVLIAQGFAAVAPTWAAAVGSSLSGVLSPAIVAALTGVAPGTAGAVSATSAALSGALAGLGASLAIFSVFLSGGLAGMAAAKEMEIQDATIQAKEITNALGAFGAVATLLDHWGTALSAVNLPGTLQKVSDALQALPDLLKAVGLNAFAIDDMVPEIRAKIGFALVTALDAAAKQGVDANFVTASRVHMVENPPNTELRIGNADGAGFTAKDLLDSIAQMRATGQGLFDDGFGSRGEKAFKAMEDILQSLIDTQGSQLGMDQNPAARDYRISPAELNAMLDKEYLVIALRNAVVDIGNIFGIGAAQFDAAGLGHDTMSAQNAQGGVDTGTSWSLQSGLNLPSVQAIADVQATLDAAGFKPGEYGKALEAFLISVDANVVNNPAWEKFTKALEAGDAAGDPDTIQKALDAAIIATMTPEKFYDSAKIITDVFAEAIKALATKQADLVTSGAPQDAIDAIGKQIEAMQVAIKAYAGLVQLYTGLPVEMAAITGDLVEQTKAAVNAWAVTAKSLSDTVTAAQKAFDEAINSGNIIAIQQAGQQLHDVAMARLQAQLKMEEQIAAATKAILDQAATLVQMVTQVAKWDIGAHGDFGTISALMTVLGTVAGIGTTLSVTATNLWAVDQALKAIIATLPSAIAKFGALQTAAEWLGTGMQTSQQLQGGQLGQIVPTVIAAAAPFLAVQQQAINQASGGAKFALLQQQASDFNALAGAAIAGVQQWATQAIAGATTSAKVVTDGIDKQIAGIQRAEQAAAESRRAEMEGLQERIAKQREFEASIKSMGQFIEQLKLGSMAPINPMDQLIQAQGTFAAALTAYNAAPTATGLGDLQAMAQAVLQAGAGVYTRPSPEYQALFGGIVAQLEAANALAKTMAPDDSTVLQAQLTALQALDRTAAQAAQDRIAELNDQKAAVAAALVTQVQAIQDAAQAEIDGIGERLALALKDNAAQQAPQIAEALAAQEEMKKAVGDTKIWQDATLDVFRDIQKKLAFAIPGAADGMAYVPRTMPVLVHQGERILTKAERLAYERGGAPTVSAPQGQRSGGPSITYSPTINVTGGGDPAMVKAVVKEALRESQRDFLRKLESGSAGSRLRSNTRSRA